MTIIQKINQDADNNCDNRTSDDTESTEGDVIYSDEDGSTPSRPGLEDVQ